MKAIIIILLLGITVSYDPKAAIAYARKYCNKYNPYYENYQEKKGSVYFASQCLYAGGQDFKGCSGTDNKGMFLNAEKLKTCLLSKGWKYSASKPRDFKAGYPIFLKGSSHAMIAINIKGNYIAFSSHSTDRCEAVIGANSVDYYYL